ncbi:cell adhesion molecule Dscam2-like [Dermacentor variabilis]|uniref:cell adhesion molecule Dscam2-like n=1 Tax=Dermacentor variabilis TaxID=34621 RepID=UPI003F5BD343
MAYQPGLPLLLFGAQYLVLCKSADTERPLIMPFSFPENAVLGQKTTVTCVVSSGAGPFHFAWTHDAMRVDSSHRRHVKIFSENVAALTVEAIAAEDVGNYTCTVSNAAGSASYTAALRVEVSRVASKREADAALRLGKIRKATISMTQGFVMTAESSLWSFCRLPAFLICAAYAVAGAYENKLAPPMIMPISLADNIALGEKILLTCAVTRGTAPFDIRWTHEGRPVTNTKNKYAAPLTGSIATLTIERVAAEDVGNYTCSASNDVGRDTVTATLMVEEAPQIQAFAFPKDPRANSKMVISCNAHVGTEPVAFVWLKDGQELRSRTKVKQKMVSETVSMLTIPEVSSEDIGNYTCEATNHFGRDTFTAALVLTESPKIQPFSFPKNHPVGKDVTATCFATEGVLPLSFAWLKDGKKLASGSKFAVRNPLDKMSTLIIHKVSGADIGNYTCQVSNEAGDDVFTAGLVVTVEPPKVQPFSFPSTKAMPKKVIVHCAVLEGTEPLKFVWTKDGLPVENGHRLHVKQHSETLSSLTITDVGAEDIGNYTCAVSNVAGSDSATSQLLVKGETI